MAIKILVFDLDGTLVDSKILYKTAIHKILRKHGYKFSKNEIEKKLGPRLDVLLKNLKVKDIGKIRTEINQYAESKTVTLKPCPNIEELKKLRLRYAICLLTNSIKSFAVPVVKKFQLDFDAVYGGEDFPNKIEGLKLLAKQFKTKPHEMIYVADRLEDEEIAEKFGCHAVLLKACSWDKKKLLKIKASNILWDLSKLPEYLNKL